MNANRKTVKTMAIVAAGSAIVAGAGLPSQAATLQDTTVDQALETSKESGQGSLSGVSASLMSMLSMSTEATVSSNQTDMVASSAVNKTLYSKVGIAHTDSVINVRESADDNARLVGYLYNNNAMTVDAEENGWLHISSGDVNGYVKADGITVGDEQTCKNAQTTDVKVRENGLRLRADASLDADILSGFAKDTVVTGIDLSKQADGWIKVRASVDGKDTEGFVSNDYVDVDTHYNYGETVEAAVTRQKAEQEAAQKAAEAASRKTSVRRGTSQRTTTAASSSQAQTSVSSESEASASGAAVVAYAAQFVGNPYVWGGTSLTSGADCSGFVLSVYKHFGISLPHSSSADRSVGRAVSTSDMQVGDIVCYSGHVGIYAGGGKIINALNPSKGITYINANYAPILAVRRVL
ncbi:C40 family peptidase [Shuttleworthella satelles]|uniref:NlpC/P60 family protein n=1 Tax=Shuttleworthella satelles DSM 14600 TaxID=626523 RepID=C4GCF3_9FIRM|nr:SH3 domain-containing C40 family peptidase [Shuttleworthia satelles]EEP27653.1 NlpC/P60 family protein [Shuttleworthia satelles DSM 14600]